MAALDKKFCSNECKNSFNYNKRKKTKSEVKTIDNFLHRNREILEVLMGNYKKMMIHKINLERAGFRFEYMTGVLIIKKIKDSTMSMITLGLNLQIKK